MAISGSGIRGSEDGGRRWVVSCDLVFEVAAPAEIVIQVAAARSSGEVVDERLEARADGDSLAAIEEVTGPGGTRLHVISAAPGSLRVEYRAELATSPAQLLAPPAETSMAGAPPSVPAWAFDRQLFLRPSRYCPNDHLTGFAVSEFGAGSDVGARVSAITEWIRERVGYVPGSSSVHDSAEDTLLTAVGTCRDFAHLGIALSRATGVPARFAAVYAPGLWPMDFHAVFETLEDGRWSVHDATGLAPRQSLVRVATGRDAADTAFAAVTSGIAELQVMEVSATVSPELPVDDQLVTVELA